MEAYMLLVISEVFFVILSWYMLVISFEGWTILLMELHPILSNITGTWLGSSARPARGLCCIFYFFNFLIILVHMWCDHSYIYIYKIKGWREWNDHVRPNILPASQWYVTGKVKIKARVGFLDADQQVLHASFTFFLDALQRWEVLKKVNGLIPGF